jgi:NADH-quinone oxidoreductase subunit M
MITATTLILVPAIAAAVLLVIPFSRRAAGYLALLVSLAVLGAVIGFAYRFEPLAGYQFGTDVAWIEQLGIRWHVAINGVSLVLIAVTALITACAIGYAMWAGRTRSHASFALILLMESALILVFSARDLVLFYVGFEVMLIPILLLLAIWGGPQRRAATLQIVAYTVVGTLLMLLGILYLGLTAPGGPDFSFAAAVGRGPDWVFAAFAIAFAIKAALFPLHGWVPLSYRQAQPEVAALLSGVASKAGGYGFLALLVPLFPEQSARYAWIFIALGLIGLLWGSLLAFRQPDSRGVIAYSSIAQMGIVILGIFLLNAQGTTGAAFQMVNHAIISAALFLLAGWAESRVGSGLFRHLGGLARGRPILASVILVVGMVALAVPGSSLFASEFLILLGAFEQHWWLGAIASLAIILAAMYMLRWISAVLHGDEGDFVGQTRPPDLRSGALLAILPLALVLIVLSVSPNLVTSRVDDATAALTAEAVAAKKVDAR